MPIFVDRIDRTGQDPSFHTLIVTLEKMTISDIPFIQAGTSQLEFPSAIVHQEILFEITYAS